MVTAKQVEADERSRPTRVFYDYNDFRLRLADSSPVHYDIGLDKLDPKGKRWVQTYRLYGPTQKAG